MISKVVRVQTRLSVNWSLLNLVLDYVSQVYRFDNVISLAV